MRFVRSACWGMSLMSVALSMAAQIAPSTTRAEALHASPTAALPITFEANHGQVDSKVKFFSRSKGFTAFLTAGGLVLALHPVQSAKTTTQVSGTSGNSPQLPATTVQFKLVGANQNSTVVGESPLPGKMNYFIGRDPAKWQRSVPTYSRVRYKSVYPGIDLVYYGSHQRLEYDFALSPGADPAQISFEIMGATQVDLDDKGNLVLQTGAGELNFASPAIYQELNGTRVPVAGSYFIKDSSHIGFRLSRYDPNAPLVIDPVLVYSTYLGGSGDDQPSGIAVDAQGSVYVAGSTDSTDFPLATLGTLPAGTHVFLAKLNPTGSSLIYADIIGGNSQDYGYALALDGAGEVYLTGGTASSDFPMVNPYQGTYPGSFNGFMTKVSADGSSLLYSTYLGGNGSDFPSSIAIDSTLDVLVAGTTTSTNFPVANAYQATVSPNQGGNYGNYGFLTKFSPDGSYLVYSTYFAGNTNVPFNCGSPCWSTPYSGINGLTVDTNGNAYLAGNTNTYNFPTTPNAYLTTNSTQQPNAVVGFVSKFSAAGSLDYSTYFYGSSGNLSDLNAIAVDSSGAAYVTGAALSDGTFPITSTSICDPSVYGLNCGNAFISKFDPTGAQLQYSTFLGLNNGGNAHQITLDANNNAYVLASTANNLFSIVNGIEQYSGGSDLLLVEIDPLATTELFATYLGASVDESPAGIVLDTNGNLYVAGSTDSSDLPISQNAFQATLGGNTDAFVLKIAPASAPFVSETPESLAYSSQNVGTTSPAQTVLLRNMGSAALTIAHITTSGDFAESDNCGGSVPAAGNCTLSVTFSPTLPGARGGSMSVADNATGSPHVVALSGIGYGSGAALSPAALVFSAQVLGTTSSPQVITLTNSGNTALNISAIQTTGDFAQTNNCVSPIAVSSSCTINVTFTPTVTGTRNGTLTVSDDARGSPQSVTLAGTGASTVTLTPGSLSFAVQPLKSSSATQTVTLANTGATTLNISSIGVTGDYAQTNNCSTQLSPSATCTIQVRFTPTASGVRSGTLTVADNAVGSPQTLSLTGSGSDFALANSSGGEVITAGSSATFDLTVSPMGGTFSSAVALTCSGAPAHSSCSLSPGSVTPGAHVSTATLSVVTSAGSAEVTPVSSQKTAVAAVWIRLQAFGLLGITLIGVKAKARKYKSFALLALLTLGLISMTACAGGTGIAPNPPPSQPGTATGTYTITVTGTAGGLQHSLPVTVTVQ